MLALHRSARLSCVKLGLEIGMGESDDEVDLRNIEEVYFSSGDELLIELVNKEVIAMVGFQRISRDQPTCIECELEPTSKTRA
jgi:hypothetical protein